MAYPKTLFQVWNHCSFWYTLPIYLLGGGGISTDFQVRVHFESVAFVNFFLLTILISAWYPFCIYFAFAKKTLVVPLLFHYSSPWLESLRDSCRAWQGILIWTWGSAWSSKSLIAWFYLAPTKWPKIDVNYSFLCYPLVLFNRDLNSPYATMPVDLTYWTTGRRNLFQGTK